MKDAEAGRRKRKLKIGFYLVLALLLLIHPGLTRIDIGSVMLMIIGLPLIAIRLLFLFRGLFSEGTEEQRRRRRFTIIAIPTFSVICVASIMLACYIPIKWKSWRLNSEKAMLIQCIEQSRARLGHPPDSILACMKKCCRRLPVESACYWRGEEHYVVDILAYFAFDTRQIVRYDSQNGDWFPERWGDRSEFSDVQEQQNLKLKKKSCYEWDWVQHVWVTSKY